MLWLVVVVAAELDQEQPVVAVEEDLPAVAVEAEQQVAQIALYAAVVVAEAVAAREVLEVPGVKVGQVAMAGWAELVVEQSCSQV